VPQDHYYGAICFALRLPALEQRLQTQRRQSWPRRRLSTSTPVDLQDKRKTRYQVNSPEVKNVYRENRYPAR
jgi:hypothetical protein